MPVIQKLFYCDVIKVMLLLFVIFYLKSNGQASNQHKIYNILNRKHLRSI